ncbi:MAG: glycosyltransferase family 39 protein [Candidatus Sungbacteria bacterium]|uniref:Glycosyltransferase family 39 protein n=1 Tax=Candidatus Sungiibacteriota bacterium TaxID=2750080 RepID=A0A931SAS9_9BACT|nr:glycosyltransferase family 39 protein [Candidatus Sungbacteria bacterium]
MKIPRNPILPLFILGLLLQLVGFFAVLSVSSSHNLPFPSLTGDSNHYRILAENLIQKRAFDIYPDRPSPDSLRTPGYPVFLALLYFIGQTWVGAVFLQSAVMGFIPVLVYLIGKRAVSEGVGFVAGVLSAFDPIQIFYSTLTLSDALFVLVLLLAVYALLTVYRESKAWWILLAGGLLGFAVLVRPIGQFLIIPALGFLFFRRPDRKRFLVASGWLLAGFLLVVAPWSVRNKLLFNSWQLSAIGNFNAAYFTMLFLEQRTGISADEWQRQLVRSAGTEDLGLLRSVDGGALSLKFARSVVLEHPVAYTTFHIVKMIPFFLNDGLRDIVRLTGIYKAPLPNVSRSLLAGEYQLLWREVRAGGVNTVLLVTGALAMLAVLALAAVGAVVGMRSSEMRLVIYFFLFIILYFGLLTGPVANARYRMPAMPFLLILAVYGAQALLQWKRGLAR